MNFLDAVRTLRKERGLSYDEAMDTAVAFFRKKGLPLPDSIASMNRFREDENGHARPYREIP
jgi:hypothetical protein